MPENKIDMSEVMEMLQSGSITNEEFTRLNALHIIEAHGYKVFAPETREYMTKLLMDAAPPPTLEKIFRDKMDEVSTQREEILTAFVAKHGMNPEEIEQVEFKDKDGFPIWRVRKISVNNGIPLPMEIVEALQAADRALGFHACMDPECGSDQCAAYQKIVALLPPQERGNIASHKQKGAPKSPASRPSMSIEQASNALSEAIMLIDRLAWDKSEKVLHLLNGFRERWFDFHEQILQSIEDALPAPLDEMGGSLPAAVASLASRLAASILEASKFRDQLATKEEAAAERWAKYAEDGTYGHDGDVSQIISDLDLYQEKMDQLGKELDGTPREDISKELQLLADLLRQACANLEPLRSIPEKKNAAEPQALVERIAVIQAHRATHAAEHDVANGKIHGYCIVCGVPFPCEYVGNPPKKSELGEWNEIVKFANENREHLGGRPGGSIPETALLALRYLVETNKAAAEDKARNDLQAMRDSVPITISALCFNGDPHEGPNILGKCTRCGSMISDPGPQMRSGNPTPAPCKLKSEEHWLVDGHDFQADGDNPMFCGWRPST